MKRILNYTIVLVLILTVSSCKKEDNPSNNSKCKVTKHTSDGIVTTYKYDVSGKLTESESPGYKSVLSHNGNTVTISNYSGNTPDGTTIVTLNAAGKPSTLTTTDPDNSVDQRTATYNAAGKLVKIEGTNTAVPDVIQVATVVYSGDNIASATSTITSSGLPIYSINYTYTYSDKEYSTAFNPELVFYALSGQEFQYFSKNLLESVSMEMDGETNTITFAYEFDSSGKVTKVITIEGGAVSNSTLVEYSCE